MNQLTTVLILALASTNASKYYRPEHYFQQEPKDLPYLAIALDEEQFIPLVEEVARWESPLDPKTAVFNNLDSFENFLQKNTNDFRIKRTKTSLSIDNPLDVLRQQYFKALARRMKYKSIEKNREHLLKTGKRTGNEVPFPVNLSKESDFQSLKDLKENGSEGSTSYSNEQKSTTRRYPNHFDDLSYQT